MGKIVAVVSSARENGNSATIVKEIMSGAMCNSTNFFYLYNLQAMKAKGCTGCMLCKSGKPCVLDDDLNKTMEDIKNADALILSTPVHFEQASWAYRMFEDRLVSLLDADGNSLIPPGKELIIVVTYSTSYDAAVALADHIEKTMVDNFKFKMVGMIIYSDHGSKDSALNDEDIKDVARRYGAMINVSRPFGNSYVVSIPAGDARRGDNTIPPGFIWKSP